MFSFTSIEQYHVALQQGKTSCVEAVKHYLERIHAHQHLNAFVEVYVDESLQRAKELDIKRKDGLTRGLLHGVVIALKDVICYKNHSLTAGSAILHDFTSLFSATAVERLLQEEAIIIGNCNCDEFAMGSTNENSVYGNVLNAIDNTRVPGGSSGGSAVAVQAGLCMGALGSDTGGSVRQPADFCGIIGLKPGYGTISRHGLIAYASSFDQIGIFSTNIPDIRIILEVISGPDEFDSTVTKVKIENTNHAENSRYRFAYFKETIDHPSLDPEIAKTFLKHCEYLQQQGHQVEAVPFEYLDFIVPAYYILTTAEASSNLSRYDGVRYGKRNSDDTDDLTHFYKRTRSEGFGKEVKRRIMLGTFVLSAGYYDAYYKKAQQVRRLLIDRTQLVFSTFDFILSPTSPSVAYKFGEKTGDPVEMYLADIYTVFANLTAIPGISLPLFKHSSGLPFGLQVLAKRYDEVSLLHVSEQLLKR